MTRSDVGRAVVMLAWAGSAAMAGAQVSLAAKETLVQLSLLVPDPKNTAERLAALKEEAARITSCEQAFAAASRFKQRGFKGNVTVRTQIPLAALPPPIRDALEKVPVGRPTPVFGTSGVLRVLIRCDARFRPPPASGEPPATALVVPGRSRASA